MSAVAAVRVLRTELYPAKNTLLVGLQDLDADMLGEGWQSEGSHSFDPF
jgi:hypothetical protein